MAARGLTLLRNIVHVSLSLSYIHSQLVFLAITTVLLLEFPLTKKEVYAVITEKAVISCETCI